VNGHVATQLANRGNRVILLDLLGHGRSDKPTHASEHRLEYACEQVVALLDHLDLDQAVIGGMSLGANVSLQVAVAHPHRVRALVCEMPVLERGTIGVMLTLLPLIGALRYGGPLVRGLFSAAQRLPRTNNEPLNAVLDAGGDPRAMAAVMHGYTLGPACPTPLQRRAITTPALVIGHRGDWMHPLDDAEALVKELPASTLIQADSFLEMRTRPDRLIGEIAGFLDDVHTTSARPR
jgi:pimeloyl-ACP methyl ester carboxylesterase